MSGCKCPPQPPPDNGVTCVSAGMIQREREASEKAASEAAAKEEPPKEAKKKGKGVKGGEKKQAAAAPVQQKPKAAAKRIEKPSPVKVNVKSQGIYLQFQNDLYLPYILFKTLKTKKTFDFGFEKCQLSLYTHLVIIQFTFE